jgi:hypothetical protein
MPTKTLNKISSIDEIEQILKNGFPDYLFIKKKNLLNIDTLIVDTRSKGKFRVRVISNKLLLIEPNIPLILAFIIGLTVIGAILMLISIKNNPVSKEMLNYVESYLNKEIPLNNDQVIIPDVCPHCKNPNTKLIRLCEWCGNQII